MSDQAQPREDAAADPFLRIHSRLDGLFSAVDNVRETVAKIKAFCPACQETIKKHETALYGDGKNGLVARVAATEQGRTDTLTVKSVCTLVGAIGALAATIGAAFAALAK